MATLCSTICCRCSGNNASIDWQIIDTTTAAVIFAVIIKGKDNLSPVFTLRFEDTPNKLINLLSTMEVPFKYFRYEVYSVAIQTDKLLQTISKFYIEMCASINAFDRI
jgi:hypothetical protein